MNKLIQFTKAYIQSMRLYYAFVTGIAGWIESYLMAHWEESAEDNRPQELAEGTLAYC